MGHCVSISQSAKTKPKTSKYSTGPRKMSKTMISKKQMTSTADSTCVGDLTTININREFHNDETSAYWLPKDDEEQRRLTGVKQT